MKTINQAAVVTSIRLMVKADKVLAEQLAALQGTFKGQPVDKIKAAVLPPICASYRTQLVEAEKGSGILGDGMTFDLTTPDGVNAKQFYYRLMPKLMGTTAERAEVKVRIPAAVRVTLDAAVRESGDNKLAKKYFTQYMKAL